MGVLSGIIMRTALLCTSSILSTGTFSNSMSREGTPTSRVSALTLVARGSLVSTKASSRGPTWQYHC